MRVSKASFLLAALLGFILSGCEIAPPVAQTSSPSATPTPQTTRLVQPTLTPAPPTETPLPATATLIPLEPTAKPPEPVEPYLIYEGWETYISQDGSYAFSYPPEAELRIEGVTGYPTNELPANMSPGVFVEQLKAQYPGDLCVSIGLGTSFLTIQTQAGSKYSGICGISGIGDYEVVNKTEAFAVGAETVSARGFEIYDNHTEGQRIYKSEFYYLTYPLGNRLNFGGDWTGRGSSYETYLQEKESLLKILASYNQDISRTLTPEFYYITPDGEVFVRSLTREPRQVAVLSDGGTVLDAIQMDSKLYVLTDRMVLEIDPINGASRKLVVLEEPALYGQLMALRAGKILYSIAIDGWEKAAVGFFDTKSGEAHLTPVSAPFFYPVGVRIGSDQVIGILRGGDPEFPEFTLIHYTTGIIEGTLPAHAPQEEEYGQGYAAVSPDGRYLAFQISRFLMEEARLEYRISLDNIALTPALESYEMPVPGSQISGGIIPASDSRSFYFILQPLGPDGEPLGTKKLWRIWATNATFNPVSDLADPSLHLVRAEPDNLWVLMQNESGVLSYLHLLSDQIFTIDLEGGILVR